MSESRPSVDPKLSFIAGWLLGRRRNRSGAGCLFLAVGLFAAMTSVAGLIGAPISWMESRAAQRLPQPSAAELQSVVQGTELIMPAQLLQSPTDEHGLVLSYAEVFTESLSAGSSNGGGTVASGERAWQRDPEPGWQTEIGLDDGSRLLLQLPVDAELLNATTVVDPDTGDRRYVGYLPGQAVIVRGSWEGDGRMTARALYAGTVDDYLRHLSRQPGFAMLAGMVCGGIALIFLMIGGILRFVGA